MYFSSERCFFVVVPICSCMCLQITFQVLETGCSSTPIYDSFLHASYLYFMPLTFISCLDVDFLSIEELFFSSQWLPMVVTPYGHVYQNADKLHLSC